MPFEVRDILPTPMEWMFFGVALLVTLPLIWVLRYFLRELKKEPQD
jgi:hypothetical protein